MTASAARLDSDRIHFQHGPIDLIIHAVGDADAVAAAHQNAWRRFQKVLPELVHELPVLRRAIEPGSSCLVAGPIAWRMWRACEPFSQSFITPMAAVAGSVADEIAALYRVEGIARASVNNGGDIAIHLHAEQRMRIAAVADVSQPGAAQDPSRRLDFEIHAESAVRGVATSGWQGRSFSLGIADSVTILSATAAEADAAATVVANAVDVQDAGVIRRPAYELQPDSDLGDRLVTVSVPPLPMETVQRALEAGHAKALELAARGRISGAILVCQGVVRILDPRGPRLHPI